jgi:short-subunit dehydrogenase
VAELRAVGVRAELVPADLNDLAQAEALIDRAEAALGPLDVLVNNAGVEYASAFDGHTRDELLSTVNINLSAPLLLTHSALPGMVQRGRGHVVFISSVAGKIAPAYEASYAATKAALGALTQSLRAEYRRGPVGFSVVAPGFVAGDGMYQRMLEQGIASNRLFGETTNEKIADAVLDAIRRDLPEVVETGAPIKPLIAFSQLAPKTTERVVAMSGLTKLFRRAAASRGRS